ncbi:MAG: hypothetical protein FWE45_01870 [Firmicutes bacterium]|nr:hypothetical protein [Bacillota bacterium]
MDKEIMEQPCKKSAFKHMLLNICVVGFAVVLTLAALVTFFVAIFREGTSSAYYIASIYILCMLLAAPTLKVFLDKVNCVVMRRLNIIGIISIFATILVITVTICISFAFPNLF